MKNIRSYSLVGAILMLLLGLLCVTMKSGVVSMALSVLGIAVLVIGVITLLAGSKSLGIGGIIGGILICVMGWTIVSIALYIVAILMIVYGITSVIRISRSNPCNMLLAISGPALTAISGFVLLFNQSGAVDSVFTIVGILLMITGAVDLFYMIAGRDV